MKGGGRRDEMVVRKSTMLFVVIVCLMLQSCCHGSVLDVYTSSLSPNFTINTQTSDYAELSGNSCLSDKCIIIEMDTQASVFSFSSNRPLNLSGFQFLEFYVKNGKNTPQMQISVALQGSSSQFPPLNINSTYYLSSGSLSDTWQLARVAINDLGISICSSAPNCTISGIKYTTKQAGRFYLDTISLFTQASSASPNGTANLTFPTTTTTTSLSSSGSNTLSDTTPPKKSKGGAIAAGIIVPIIVIGAAIVGYLYWRKRQDEKAPSPDYRTSVPSSPALSRSSSSPSSSVNNNNNNKLSVRVDSNQPSSQAPPLSSQAQVNHSHSRIFGETLQQATKGQVFLPKILEDCIKYLTDAGLDEVGILRLAGSTAEVNTWRDKYDRGETVDFSTCSDIHSVGALMKKYLRELQDPIIPRGALQNLSDWSIASIPDDERIRGMQEQISAIDPLYALTARAVLGFLHQVALRAGQNKMSSSNLALVFSPTLHIGPDLLDFMIKNDFAL